MKKVVSLIVLVALCAVFSWAQEAKSKELERVDAAEKVLHEIMATPDKGIPQEILADAECVAVVPSMLKGGLIFGARYGRGIATCRTAAHSSAAWSAPAPIRIEGGSWGLQIGGEAVDLVMLAMNQKGMQDLLKSKFKIGADASAAAGPVGRHAEGATDWKMRSEILTYSRARGAFAGISLDGAVVKQDTDDTLALYGKFIPAQEILSGKVPPPAGTQPFLTEVRHYFGEATAVKTAEKKQEGKTEKAEAKPYRANEKAQENAPTAGGMTGSASAPSSGSAVAQSGSTGAVSSPAQSAAPSTSGTTTETNQAGTQESRDQSSNMSGAASNNDKVRTNIQNALHNTPNLATGDVNVNVTDSQVMLSGSVPNQSDKATIHRLAEQNASGRRVEDNDVIVK